MPDYNHDDRPHSQQRRDDDIKDDPPPRSGWMLPVLIISGVVLLLVVVGGLALVLLLPAVQSIREAAARTQSQNNLKEIAIGLHNCMAMFEGKAPPSVGQFPAARGAGPDDTFFYHLLPYVQQENVFRKRTLDASIKMYLAPQDPTAKPDSPRTSYATNFAVFGKVPRRYYGVLVGKGISNSVVLVERFAVTRGEPHNWSDTGHLTTFIDGPLSRLELAITPDTASPDAAHALGGGVCQVLLGDGSARVLKSGDEAFFRWACDPTKIGKMPAGE